MTEIKPFYECEYAPNILYKVVENKTEHYQNIKKGYLIRLPNCNPPNCPFCYWDNNSEFHQEMNSHFYEDWAKKIYVEYDREFVGKTLINNAKEEHEHYKELADMAEKRMEMLKEKYSK